MQLSSFRLLRAVSLVFALFILITSCQKGNTSEGTKQLQIFLTDGPAGYDAVNIDIQSVEAKVDTCDRTRHDDHFGDRDEDRDDHERRRDEFGNWVSLNAAPGIYDVLKLRNGIDTLLANGTINGRVRKIRITLGENNTVVKDGVSYPLQLINPTMNFLYIKLNDEHRRDSSDKQGVWVDFDLSRSVIAINGKYYLRPVLRPFCDRNFGEVEGKVTPAAAGARVVVYNAKDTSTAIPNPDGFFKVRGLPGGSYSVLFDASNGYQDTTINNVQLINGREVRLPAVVLHQ